MKRDKNGRFLKGFRHSAETEFKKGHHWRKSKNFWNKEWLKNEYINKQKSAQDIACENGCIENNILYWLKKHNIETRSISEVRKIKKWGLKGKHNPMFGKKCERSSNWKGGITPEREALYCQLEWKEIAAYIWERDKGKCNRCNKEDTNKRKMHVHHIYPFYSHKAKRCDIDHLILLCSKCHGFIHSKLNVNNEFLEGGE